MSIHSRHMHQVPSQGLYFTRPVGLFVAGDWVFIESVEKAQACLQNGFEDQTGPSWNRAIATCAVAVAVAGQVPPDAAQATLIVAAMEAGVAFEVIEDDSLVLERNVEAAAAKGLEELFLAEAAE
jgi:hypothetical protein